MSRPPKRFKPRAHPSSDEPTRGRRAFRKGRFPTTPEQAAEEAAAGQDRGGEIPIFEVGPDETATANASFSAPPAATPDSPAGRSLRELTVTSKYDARPSSGTGRVAGDDSRDDVVIDLTAGGRLERRVVVDLTKLPPVDESLRSETYYVRHSAGWPVLGD